LLQLSTPRLTATATVYFIGIDDGAHDHDRTYSATIDDPFEIETSIESTAVTITTTTITTITTVAAAAASAATVASFEQGAGVVEETEKPPQKQRVLLQRRSVQQIRGGRSGGGDGRRLLLRSLGFYHDCRCRRSRCDSSTIGHSGSGRWGKAKNRSGCVDVGEETIEQFEQSQTPAVYGSPPLQKQSYCL
jgi:hypothetical protein